MLSRRAKLKQAGHRCGRGPGRDPRPRRDAGAAGRLEVLPRKRIDYQGHALEELDLDACSRAGRPCARRRTGHRNVPGSRHERRWQDVIELLDAGIDVYTTVNIQHLESLNDVVHRITGGAGQRDRFRTGSSIACATSC
jgi:two-component system sensor histidine kinase KdpD